MTIDQVSKVRNFVNDVSFKVISDEEVRKLSILQITNHRSFDENQLPVENSVHDLRLGERLETIFSIAPLTDEPADKPVH